MVNVLNRVETPERTVTRPFFDGENPYGSSHLFYAANCDILPNQTGLIVQSGIASDGSLHPAFTGGTDGLSLVFDAQRRVTNGYVWEVTTEKLLGIGKKEREVRQLIVGPASSFAVRAVFLEGTWIGHDNRPREVSFDSAEELSNLVEFITRHPLALETIKDARRRKKVAGEISSRFWLHDVKDGGETRWKNTLGQLEQTFEQSGLVPRGIRQSPTKVEDTDKIRKRQEVPPLDEFRVSPFVLESIASLGDRTEQSRQAREELSTISPQDWARFDEQVGEAERTEQDEALVVRVDKLMRAKAAYEDAVGIIHAESAQLVSSMKDAFPPGKFNLAGKSYRIGRDQTLGSTWLALEEDDGSLVYFDHWWKTKDETIKTATVSDCIQLIQGATNDGLVEARSD